MSNDFLRMCYLNKHITFNIQNDLSYIGQARVLTVNYSEYDLCFGNLFENTSGETVTVIIV